MTKPELQQRFEELSAILLKELSPQGFWTGELSSSALAVAVAVAALHFHDREAHRVEIQNGLVWLQDHVNADGSFGDTPESPGNVSTSLLVYAATNLYAATDGEITLLQKKIATYLSGMGIDVRSPQVARFILDHYQKDYTFSVPILTLCGLCGVPGPEAFSYIPQLPFELSLLPRKFYRLLNLSVVSYAIPALVAVGIVVFKKKKTNAFSRFVRGLSVQPALKLLHRLMPDSGGFLEAIPLTAFVCLSLIEAGYRDLEVVERGIGFLKKTQRDDGSWPIDIDLSTWVTSLSVKALRTKKEEVLIPRMQQQIANHLLAVQNLEVHPFNGSQPGGWGWTNHSGSVPDGDDTPGAMLALLQLQPGNELKQPLLAACEWLLQLQNSDGGFPTFSKGWGKLPFDQSCADLTGHCLLAVSACLNAFGQELDSTAASRMRLGITRMANYLEKHQRGDGSWLPLWFGNQHTDGHVNPVYGTARVLTYLQDALGHSWMDEAFRTRLLKLIQPAEQFLRAVQNEDGSWGGGKNIRGSMEETALAVAALSGSSPDEPCLRGIRWLDDFYCKNGLKASPIGLYFASLWYDEKLYPLTAYLEAVVRLLERK
ncbi:prenyltransferase/squalene oxidase repeat-containing protein [Gaoshiqia sediminis]|uniref:Squalene--hopene cyclase n=1 Tax=Gaoshiqia sediminis TaxID=2986998 RepID=A0AA41Y739_9BACT|nr:prenyltransferase/squalene oxidase repeat-containing protein [Gaoshiqia sediminis]MCW0484634.1 hypothetical protein [Gaoshiqia sediminis]